MVLNIPGLFGDNNFFDVSPEDNDNQVWNGQRWVASVQGLKTQTKFCDTLTNNAAVGTIAWANVGYDLGDAYTGIIGDAGAGDGATDSSVRLYYNAGWQGNNVAKGVAWDSGGAYNNLVYGGKRDIFGNNLTPALINHDSFGFGVSVVGLTTNPATSNYLYFYDFKFSIPQNAIITGVKIEVRLAAFSAANMSVFSEGQNAGWASATMSVTYEEADTDA